ncbi:CobW family GTP-binding protein [Clostridium sp. YIM B02506]|uniref:CobW family GTP-binding protein n=1 Tax=Clostridium sp. YIM B02506 TaxID=2910680 RepID=UPI001EEF742F|nr:CobW family GTP-binding protein [Clostridium sp. YIM B02506]
MKIKVDVFSGFLGAGKTLLIKKLIEENLKNEKIAIIENEFGEIGIDGGFLRNSSIDVKEINAGCICCSVYGDFKAGINEVIDKYHPERIIIEPSGVAKLSEVLSVFKESDFKQKLSLNIIMTVIDITKYDMYVTNFDEFYKDQIRKAKTIILSRTQNVSNETVVDIVSKIKTLNNSASIITTPWTSIKAKNILETAEGTSENTIFNKINLLNKSSSKVSVKTSTISTTKTTFKTIGIETPKILTKNQLKNTLEKLNNSMYGLVLRAKGIVECTNGEWVEFDYVPNEFEIRKSIPDYSGRICVIGENLNKDIIEKLFH